MVLPDGRCDIIVRNNINTPEQITPVITGPATQAFTVAYDAGDQWFGIRLRPEKGRSLWQTELCNAVGTLLRGEQTHDRFPNLSGLTGATLTRDALAQAVATYSWPDGEKRLVKAINLLHATGGRMRIDAVTERVACSPRHLHRLFRHHVGLSAKVYAQLAQFHRTLKLITTGQLPITDAAFEGGYADHAHMTRAFRRFGGFAPSEIPSDLSLPQLFPQ